MCKKRVTVRDLSKYCGVSTATVSRVINNNGRFSEDTRRHVLEAVEKLGYIPDNSAKSLRTQSSRVVGILMNHLDQAMPLELMSRMQDLLFNEGFTPMLCNIESRPDRELFYLNMLQSIHACAIIVMMNCGVSDRLLNAGIPIIFAYRNPMPGHLVNKNICVVQTDDYAAGVVAGEELLRLGCKRISEVRVRNADQRVPLGRRLGLMNTLFRYNMDYDEALEIIIEGNTFDVILNAMNQKLDSGSIADGYFCVNDVLALALIASLAEHGYRVPEDVKVIGCNDMYCSTLSVRPITTIRHDENKICEMTVNLLKRMLKGEVISVEERMQTVPVTLIRRATT